MAVNLSPIGGVAGQFFDNNGNPLSGGRILTYSAGTTTPQATYTSAGGGTPHANPIILDAAGRVPGGEIWLTDGLQYKFILQTSTSVQIGSYDNVIGINSNFVNYTNAQEIQTATAGQTVFTLTTMQYQPGTNSLSVFVDGVNQYGPGSLYAYEETSATVVTFASGLHVGAQVKFTTSSINASSYGDAEQISYSPPYPNSVATNVEVKLAQTISIKDFGAVGDGATDDNAAIQAALNYAGTIGPGATVTVPYSAGEYIFTSLSVPSGVAFVGTGGVLKLKNNTCVNPAVTYYLIYNLTGSNVRYENLVVNGNGTNNTQFLVADVITATGANVVVKGCRITDAPDSAIFLSSATNGICCENILDGGADLGIYVSYPETAPFKGELVISDNNIRNFPYGGIGLKRSIESCVVANNLIYSCGNGITVEDFGAGLGGAPDHLLITGNLMRDIGYPYALDPLTAQIGVSLNGCTYVSVVGNKIQNVSGVGIGLSGTTDSTIQNNLLTGYVTLPAASGNNGIYCDTRSGVTPTRNNITGNICTDFDDYGAYFLALTNSVVNENLFKSADTAIRINAPCDNNTVSFNRFNGALADTAILPGADANILQYNYHANASTEWEKAGHIRSISVATPVGNITPNYPGQLCWITTAGPKIFLAYGITNTEWVQIG